MDDDVLAVTASEAGDWRHGRAAGAGSVAGGGAVDVAGVEAVRAVVAVPAAGRKRAD